MRDWQVEQDARDAEARPVQAATLGDVERASEIAAESVEAVHERVRALEGRLERAEAALADAQRRLDVSAERRRGDERDTRRLVERVESLERRLADIGEQADEAGDGGRS